jgi:NitT/TauT family transport system substrate-binding protein
MRYTATRKPVGLARIALALVASVALVGCGSGEESAKEKNTDGTTTVTFAYTPSPGIAPIFVGIRQGFFKDAGINLKPVVVAPGQLSPTIMSGETDLSFDAIQGVLGSVSNGLPIKAVAQTSTNGEGAVGGTGRDLLVLKGSGITSIAQLAGKKLGVQRLGAAGDVAVQALVERASSKHKVKVLALPSESMQTSLINGDVDAVNVSDPTASQMMASGKFDALGDPPLAAFGSAPDKVVIATTKWIDANPKIVKALQEAIARSDAYAQANVEAVREVLVTDWKTPADVAKLTHWPAFTDKIDVAQTQQVADTMTRLGYLSKTVEASSLFATPDRHG